MKKELTKEQKKGQLIVKCATHEFGIEQQLHTMTSLSKRICSNTTWVETYKEMEGVIRYLKLVGAKEEQITHRYDKNFDLFIVTFECNMI